MAEVVARLPCKRHGRYDAHGIDWAEHQEGDYLSISGGKAASCPGGEEIILTREDEPDHPVHHQGGWWRWVGPKYWPGE